MPGSITGGKKAAATNKSRYGADYYANIGRMGGAKSRGGGFATSIDCDCTEYNTPHLKRRCAGKKGGTISRKPKKVAQ